MKSHILATCNNYFCTNQKERAKPLLEMLSRLFPKDFLVKNFVSLYEKNLTQDHFGVNWTGQDLSGKSIEIFSDQGMGDLINMLRYLPVIKDRWKSCTITLNCYPYYDQFERLLHGVTSIDRFVYSHVRCDYHTNILSVPAILAGLKYDVYYPAHFKDLLEKTTIPQQVSVYPYKKPDDFKIGIAWESNPENNLFKDKSIPLPDLVRLEKFKLHSLIPHECNLFLPNKIKDLLDTAELISQMSLVISVDTVVLHLAGVMGVPTWGLLPVHADPRWGRESKTIWYPSVTLFRNPGSWLQIVKFLEKELEKKPS